MEEDTENQSQTSTRTYKYCVPWPLSPVTYWGLEPVSLLLGKAGLPSQC